jgi:AraC-like DNA-binding protein
MTNATRIAGTRLLSAGHVAPDPSWRMEPHSHTFHELILVVDGKLWVEHERGTLSAVEGDVLLYPAGAVHTERSDAAHPMESHFLAFECAGLTGLCLGKAADAGGRMRQMARWLYEDGHVSSPVALAGREALLQAILAEYLRHDGSEDQPLVVTIRRHIAEHIGDALSLAGLGRVAGFSKYHFLRRYRAATGRTPMQDVRAMRANYARELILGTNLPLKDIAPKAGLGNVYAMSRVFQRLFGMPPGQYGRNRRGCAQRSG